jgi:DNA polymerase-3 subunit delta'
MLFKDVIGHKEIKNKLIKSVKNNRISHAQLFLGPEGNGNFQLALAYAQFINCLNQGDNDSCGSCSSCLKHKNKQHPDLHFFYPTAICDEIKTLPSSRKLLKPWVEFLKTKDYFTLNDWMSYIGAGERFSIINKTDSQDIIKIISLKNFEAKFKVIIIWWPETMNSSCSNKILKALEEPNPKTLFLLVGHNTDKLLPTIVSRVQIIKTNLLKDSDVIQGLIDKEKIPDNLAKSLALKVNGNLSKAFDLIKYPDSEQQFMDIFHKWMRLCYTVDFLSLEKWVEEIYKLGRVVQKSFLEYGLRIFRECIIYNYSNSEINRLNKSEEIFNEKFSKFIHGGNIVEIVAVFEHTHTAILRNANGKIAFMNLSLKICNLIKLKP